MGFTPGMEEWFNMRASINVIQHTNRTKDKKPHESLKRYRKGTWQNPMSFHDKNSQKQGMEGKFLKILKAIMKTAQLPLNSMVKKKESFPSKIRNKMRMPTFIGEIQRCTRSANQSN